MAVELIDPGLPVHVDVESCSTTTTHNASYPRPPIPIPIARRPQPTQQQQHRERAREQRDYDEFEAGDGDDVDDDVEEEHRKNEFVQQFNARNAKIIAFFIVCGFVLYHSVLRLSHGLDSCNWLLSDGNFRDQVWQPYGCMMHHYSHVDSRRCLRYMEYWNSGSNYFVFIGDSRMEQLYHSFIHQISPGYRGAENLNPAGNPSKSQTPFSTRKPLKLDQFGEIMPEDDFWFPPEILSRRDLSFNDSQLGLSVRFLWEPVINKSMLKALQQLKNSRDKPSVLVIGSGAYSIKSRDPLDPTAVDDYTSSLTHLLINLDQLSSMEKTRVLWALQEPIDPEKLSTSSSFDQTWLSLTNERIEVYNDAARRVLRYSKAGIWSSSRLVAVENLGELIDGFHLGSRALFHDSQILLNMYCNDNMNFNDATCCSSSESISKLQLVTFSVLFLSSFLAVVLYIRNRWLVGCYGQKTNSRLRPVSYHRLKNHQNNQLNDPIPSNNSCYQVFSSLGKLALILTFFFICDRTTMFMKENKYFTQTNFWLPVVYIIVLGLFFTEDSQFTKVLHHDQDYETKGWMVLLILVYNMMGASQVLPIYLFVKILYSAFLFLHGWSQFTAYVHRGDYSIVRVLQDLFRLNVMAVLLCICMNRPYQFYEFIPLISFWTVIVYIALSLPPRITWALCDTNSFNYLPLVFKIVGLIGFVTVLYMSEVFFEKVFVTRPWKALFVTTDDDIHDWWTRWKIDRYSMPAGMIFAFGSHLARKYQILDDNNHGNLFSMKISLMATLFSVLGILGYASFSIICRNQLECVEVHSYIGFVPILSYLLLRNLSGILRTRFSSFFSWFGEFWVELLVGQYHVWMGADGHGVLVLVPAYPVGNVLLTAFVFACTAHEVHSCTETLVHYAVPEHWKKALRNLGVFLLVLVPIGISDGMF